MIASRAPGYHTRPHAHESEQINYVLEGEIWFFVEDKGFLCRKGDLPTRSTGPGTAPTPMPWWPRPMRRPCWARGPAREQCRCSTMGRCRRFGGPA